MLRWTRHSDARWYAASDATEYAAEVDHDADGWHATRLDDPSGYPVDRGVHDDLSAAMAAVST